MLCVVVLPDCWFLFFVLVIILFLFSCRGDSQESMNYIYTRSPLSEPEPEFCCCEISQCRGDSQGSRNLLLSFSPLFFSFCCFLFDHLFHVGEIHRVGDFV